VATELQTLANSSKILVAPYRERVKGDVRHGQGISRLEGNSSSIVTRVCLENKPGLPVALRDGNLSVTFLVALEQTRETAHKNVGRSSSATDDF
jgi:hypothetical protein